MKRTQKSTRWEEKSGTLDEEGRGKEKQPIRISLQSSCERRGMIPAAILARAAVYSLSNSANITTESIV
ncbi:hypothetical protein Bca52824_070138 [Brassica carinata]|uniref:Uncharacterized protein n=1 Tax=Brassica carinata TaxID=52824 RepID=A0A8X7Q3D3_BRACI|nr:hypothetical protein Bca52824_070138 [Brassica carinata]